MSAKIITAKIGSDGKVVQVLEDGTEQSFPETTIRPWNSPSGGKLFLLYWKRI